MSRSSHVSEREIGESCSRTVGAAEDHGPPLQESIYYLYEVLCSDANEVAFGCRKISFAHEERMKERVESLSTALLPTRSVRCIQSNYVLVIRSTSQSHKPPLAPMSRHVCLSHEAAAAAATTRCRRAGAMQKRWISPSVVTATCHTYAVRTMYATGLILLVLVVGVPGAGNRRRRQVLTSELTLPNTIRFFFIVLLFALAPPPPSQYIACTMSYQGTR